MKRILLSTLHLACALACVVMVACRGEQNSLGYIVVSDYVDPSCGEDVSDVLQQIINDNPNRTIYFPDGDFKFGCTQEFDVLPGGQVYQPRIISGCDLTPFMEVALISELNMHYINSHFTHPDDALDPDRGAEIGWETLSENFGEYLEYLYKEAPSIRNFTGSETSAAVQRYVALNVESECKNDKITLKIGNFYDEGYFLVRFNNKDFKSVDDGELTHITGNLYLLKAEKETVTINLK